jgi:hypothetical protein
MLIVNKKYKDYYDGVAGTTGIDKTIVYERQTKEIVENKEIPKPFHIKRGVWNEKRPFIDVLRTDIDRKKTKKYRNAYCFIVGFCGKLYLGWKLIHVAKGWNEKFGVPCDVERTDIVYGYDNVKAYIKTEYWNTNIWDNVKYIENYDPMHVFREVNAPVFIFDGDDRKPRRNEVFIINPVLKDYEFYKVIDAFTAFQELQMFIGGVLGTSEKEIIEVEDKYKIPQHGFNKWSFRREPKMKK